MLGGLLMIRYWRGQPPFGAGADRAHGRQEKPLQALSAIGAIMLVQ